MKSEIIDIIAEAIDDYIIIRYKDVETAGLDGLKYFIFNDDNNAEYVSNKYIYEPLGITLPSDKTEYYKLIYEVKKYYDSAEYFNLDIDTNNLFQHSERLSHLYGLMKYNDYKYEAFKKYINNSKNTKNIKFVMLSMVKYTGPMIV